MFYVLNTWSWQLATSCQNKGNIFILTCWTVIGRSQTPASLHFTFTASIIHVQCCSAAGCRLPIVLMSAVWFPSAALWGCRLSVSILQHCSQLSGWRAHTALQHCSTLHTPINILTHFCLDLTRDAAPPSPQHRAAGGWWLPGYNLQLQCCRSSAEETTTILHFARLYIYKCMI